MGKRALGLLAVALGAILVLQLSACGAGYRTSVSNGHEKVYRVDEDGTKTLVYEVEKDGKVTIHDESDPKAQQMIAAQEREEMARVAEEDRIERILAAPKRNDNDPIYVALYDVELDEGLQKAQHSEGAVYNEYRKHFENDGVIELVSADKLKKNEWSQLAKALKGASPNAAPPADVDVVTRAYVKEVVGINKQTGKPGKMAAIVFEAKITCNFVPAEYNVTESGNIFRNADVTRKFAEEVKNVIKTKIGPTIPADRRL